jgi:hypothetical protein
MYTWRQISFQTPTELPHTSQPLLADAGDGTSEFIPWRILPLDVINPPINSCRPTRLLGYCNGLSSVLQLQYLFALIILSATVRGNADV